MWLLILVMIGADNPNVMTIPLDSYATEEICYEELIELEIKAQDDSGQAALVCLYDARPEPVDINDIRPEKLEPRGIDDSLILAKRMQMKLEKSSIILGPGIIMSGA